MESGKFLQKTTNVSFASSSKFMVLLLPKCKWSTFQEGQAAEYLGTNSGKKLNKVPLIHILLKIQDIFTQLQDNLCYSGLVGYHLLVLPD